MTDPDRKSVTIELDGKNRTLWLNMYVNHRFYAASGKSIFNSGVLHGDVDPGEVIKLLWACLYKEEDYLQTTWEQLAESLPWYRHGYVVEKLAALIAANFPDVTEETPRPLADAGGDSGPPTN